MFTEAAGCKADDAFRRKEAERGTEKKALSVLMMNLNAYKIKLMTEEFKVNTRMGTESAQQKRLFMTYELRPLMASLSD